MLAARRALISVYDKTGLEELARGLARLGIEIVSTGGTMKFLEEKGIPATAVSGVTRFPEILDGRVKTLHPGIHGGILANRDVPAHLEALAEHGIGRIDLVVVNLYPFRETAARGASFGETVEMIDVGGPAMVRAAAKNFAGVAVVVDPADYPALLAALAEGGGTVPEAPRRRLALKAFQHTARYDAAIAEWLAAQEEGEDSGFPPTKTLELRRERVLRYGENPHQGGAVYSIAGGPGVLGGFRSLQGKELSWNNLLDADAARKMAGLFAEPAVVIVKHNNPCGIGRGADLAEAYRRAFAADPESAFGSVVAVNRRADGALAEALADLFVEVLAAPGFDEAARERLAAKKNLRLIEAPPYRPSAGDVELRPGLRHLLGDAAALVLQLEAPLVEQRLRLAHDAVVAAAGIERDGGLDARLQPEVAVPFDLLVVPLEAAARAHADREPLRRQRAIEVVDGRALGELRGDDARIALAHVLVADAEPLAYAGAERLHEHVGRRREREQPLAILGLLEIEHDALLAAVQVAEVNAGRSVGRPDAPRRIAVRRLDLDDLRAMIGQRERQVRPRQEHREVDDAQTL